MQVLNLGCGNKIEPGAVNHDRIAHRPEVDVVHDLNQFPWPWPDESFDQIIARAVLEHLDCDLLTSVNECWRIMRAEGTLHLKLPVWDSEGSYDDPTHRWRFTMHSCDVFDPETENGRLYSFYTPYKWRIMKAPHYNPGHSSLFFELRKLEMVG